ncbi:MAG: hypothetical protein A3G24_19925 [Betaproteobacteria bacterium RIFCSPLOWO2_12_FULL_62_13]|nr:MAG: hypothetical protein A3G24_19925 [Betaproteobacteria bacterium RIFCSPLOWO2_12_FULL_62_13]
MDAGNATGLTIAPDDGRKIMDIAARSPGQHLIEFGHVLSMAVIPARVINHAKWCLLRTNFLRQ